MSVKSRGEAVLPQAFWPRDPAAKVKPGGRKEASWRACREWRRRRGTGRGLEGLPAFDFLEARESFGRRGPLVCAPGMGEGLRGHVLGKRGAVLQ
ncbi:MAG: hypothetical protein L5656_10000 [Thermanaeromonas sp.]|nr:hypothetical protein [Thermanaeromonas sp.]